MLNIFLQKLSKLYRPKAAAVISVQLAVLTVLLVSFWLNSRTSKETVLLSKTDKRQSSSQLQKALLPIPGWLMEEAFRLDLNSCQSELPLSWIDLLSLLGASCEGDFSHVQSKDLNALQRRFAQEAESSARQMVQRKARAAGDQGKLVEQANLLQKAGATTESRATMLWRGALDALRLPSERVSSRWLGAEALMLASAPYRSTKDLVEDLQLAAVKRLLPHIDDLADDDALAEAVADIAQVFEDTVYAVAHDVIAVLKRYAEIDKAVSGPADLPMLSVLQSIREHIATLVHPGFIGATPPASLPRLATYLQADLLRLNKAKADKNRDVRWAWEADEARQLVDAAVSRAKAEPAGPRHESLTKQANAARWMLEEFYVSLWAQELGTSGPVSLQRIRKALQ